NLSLCYAIQPRRIHPIHWVVTRVNVRIQSERSAEHSLLRVSAQKAPCPLVIVPRPQVVEAEVGVKLLAAVQEVVWARAVAGDQAAEGVVLIGVGDRPSRVRQTPHAALTVADANAARPGRRV